MQETQTDRDATAVSMAFFARRLKVVGSFTHQSNA
jgi:hypothetical protein